MANDAARNDAAGVVAPDAELGAPTGAAGVGGTTSGKGAGYTSQPGIASKFAQKQIQSRLDVAKALLEDAKNAFKDCAGDNSNDNDEDDGDGDGDGDDEDGDGNEVSLLFIQRHMQEIAETTQSTTVCLSACV